MDGISLSTVIKKKFIPAPLLALLILPWLFLFLYQQRLQKQVNEKDDIVSLTGIHSLEKINLGGIDQWILIRGWDKSSPVLLFLHGGPGAPLFTYARDIGVKAKLEQNFVMVYWEQRGTGKSYSPFIPAESMTIEQFISDTHELANYLRHHFNVPKIFLLGRSWGSIIGILCAERYPELFHAYVGIGQMVDPLENDRISYEYTLETAARLGNNKALDDLKEIGPPPYDYKALAIQRKWLTKFHRLIISDKIGTSFPKSSSRKKLLSTPEYSLIDILKMGIDPYFSTKHLWNSEFYEINLVDLIPRLDLPVYFLAGRYDYFTPSEIVEHYYDRLIAPEGKELIWFEYSGHEPEFEEPDKFYDIMVNKIAPSI